MNVHSWDRKKHIHAAELKITFTRQRRIGQAVVTFTATRERKEGDNRVFNSVQSLTI